MRRTNRRKQTRRRQRGGARSGSILTADIIKFISSTSGTPSELYKSLKNLMNIYFIGKNLKFTKNDGTSIEGTVTEIVNVNISEDTYVIHLGNKSIPFEDIINNVYTKITISDIDEDSTSGYSISTRGYLKQFIIYE